VREPKGKNQLGHQGPKGGGVVSLRGTRVSESTSPLPSELGTDFKVTLLELPPLPVSLPQQISCWWKERRTERQSGPEAPLPILDMKPWFRNLPGQLRALFSAKPVSGTFTSTPVDVPNIWQDYLPNPYSWANSVLVHLLVLTALMLPFLLKPLWPPPPLPSTLFNYTHISISLPPLQGKADANHGGGGGGERMPLQASHGALPPFSRTQFTPPTVHIPKTQPLLPMSATVIGPPELKLPAMKLDMPFGDPTSSASIPSGGPGSGAAIGSGKGTGVGPGEGPGVGPGRDGNCCGGTYQVGGSVSAPEAIYSPEPAYSEEARKAKFGGTVLLWIVVDAQGAVRNIRVAKPLGMGLDEQAVKTVGTWKFKPSMKNGVPVPVQIEVEVTFRLF
jgi:periplasmic protein TonB